MTLSELLMPLDYVKMVVIEENGVGCANNGMPPYSVRIGIGPKVADENRSEVGNIIAAYMGTRYFGNMTTLVGEELYVAFKHGRVVRWTTCGTIPSFI